MRISLLLTVWLVATLAQAQQVPSVQVTALPEAFVPAGQNADWFGLGWGGRLTTEWPPLASLSPTLGLSYGWLPLRSADALQLVEAQAGLGWPIPLAAGFTLTPFLQAGYGWGEVSTQQFGGGIASTTAGTGLQFQAFPGLDLTARVAYAWRPGLVGGALVSLGVGTPVSLASGPRTIRLLDLSGLTLGTVFPVFRNYYDDHALGKVTLKNTSNQTARDIKVSLSIKQYMDGPKESPVVDELRPGQSVDVNLFALFQNAILDVTEATKSTAVVSVRYRAGDEDALQEQTATVRVFDRNAMTWDDDRKAAAFVSGKDPWVLELSNQMTAAAKTLRNPGLDQNLQTVLLFHEGLRLMGLSYVTNPKSPFSQTFAHPETVDFLKFPRQTLSYKAGDCSDLSILYASFFESVGLETAFITVPGHIYMAVKLGVSPEQASQSPVLSGRVIIRNEAVWLPIETTMREARFTDAWQEGIRDWKQNVAEGTEGFFPVHEAWKTFQPVGLSATSESPPQTSGERVAEAFGAELASVLDREITGRMGALDEGFAGAKNSPKYRNDRGVILARFGRYDQARTEFLAAGASGTYVPPMVNLGNLALLKSDYTGALEQFQKALGLHPADPKILVNMVRAEVGLGNVDQAKAQVAELQTLDSNLAGTALAILQVSDTGARAAEVKIQSGDLTWN